MTLSVEKFAPKAKIVHVDVDPAEIGKNVMVDLPIVGDLKRVLEDLLGLVAEREKQEWIEQVYRWRKEQPLQYEENHQELKPQRVLEKLGEMTRERNVIVTADVGQHQIWAAQYYRFPPELSDFRRLGHHGLWFSAAIGAQLAAPDATVIAVRETEAFKCIWRSWVRLKNNLPVKILCSTTKIWAWFASSSISMQAADIRG